ncbi:MAG: twin-arginine translocase TatA/TatE family subunit [Chloroflexi bacterium]|nr:twin-arginine translocase TatA/TatE family subunit [Chloroflexota bacterium]
MPSIGPTELVIILVLALIIFGAGKLSDVGGALGKSIREFRHAAVDDDPKPERPASTEAGNPPSPQA